CDQPSATVANDSGDYMNTRNIAAIKLPAELFGKTAFKVGDRIQFDSTYFTQARADWVEWKGGFTLAGPLDARRNGGRGSVGH
ncbi:MAG: hypothetical protein ACREE6_13210, partial [Limisphaerales bacterium]